jgi:carboxyl-terminal processing protease
MSCDANTMSIGDKTPTKRHVRSHVAGRAESNDCDLHKNEPTAAPPRLSDGSVQKRGSTTSTCSLSIRARVLTAVTRRKRADPFCEALRLIAERDIFHDPIGWPAILADGLAFATDQRTYHGALRRVLARLGDRHARVLEPEAAEPFRRRWANGTRWGIGMAAVHPECVVVDVTPGGPADQVGIRVGDGLRAVNGSVPRPQPQSYLADLGQNRPHTSLTLDRPREPKPIHVLLKPELHLEFLQPRVRTVCEGVRWLELPRVGRAGASSYVTAVHRILSTEDLDAKAGWIVDLRRNYGGDLYALLAAVGPLLGEQRTIGGIVGRNGKYSSWMYKGGYAWLGGLAKGGVATASRLEQPENAIAVLTSRLTASAGEGAVVAFRHHPRCRSFGEPTFGIPTALEDLTLRDGTVLGLSAGTFADRSGRSYYGRIEPDQPVAIEWHLVGSATDPVLATARDWVLAASER